MPNPISQPIPDSGALHDRSLPGLSSPLVRAMVEDVARRMRAWSQVFNDHATQGVAEIRAEFDNGEKIVPFVFTATVTRSVFDLLKTFRPTMDFPFALLQEISESADKLRAGVPTLSDQEYTEQADVLSDKCEAFAAECADILFKLPHDPVVSFDMDIVCQLKRRAG